MTKEDTTYIPKLHRIQQTLGQYPILGDIMRQQMRRELFRRGVISREAFEAEVKDKAIQSQAREGLVNPHDEETAEIWERRLAFIRAQQTEFYFAFNLNPQLFEDIVREVLARRPTADQVLSLNPEMAPLENLFLQLESYALLPPEEQARVRHHMQEVKVVLIKALISDDLEFVRIAKEYLELDDLKWIRNHRVGRGKIGGKAAGLVLAWKLLQRTVAHASEKHEAVRVALPQTYFVGADVSYEFLNDNGLVVHLNQKYKDIETIASEYPEICAAYERGRFSPDILEQFRELLSLVGRQPLIVRSSSLLEDNFELSFAGMYESVFCPNQGTPEENLNALRSAIAHVYASIYNPNVLLYRKQRGYLDYDERMAVMIQVVQGERYRDCFFPAVAGVAYSRNPYLWSPRLRREDGFARLVVGLGTRAVERVGEDYPRMVSLSHPALRPEKTAQEIRYYSQYYMDVINLKTNQLHTTPANEVLRGDYPALRQVASVVKDDFISPIVVADHTLDADSLVITLDGLLNQTAFAGQLREVLKALELGYGRPVDIEYTVVLGREYPRPSVEFHLLQCRPQSGLAAAEQIRIPQDVPQADILFGTDKLVPTGRVTNIAYVVYVRPEQYGAASPSQKLELGRLIGRINQRLDGQRFILMGPGRWGSSNPDLGVKVGYADFYNTSALVEVAWTEGQGRPTLSYGTHFFQDLVESNIYPLAIYPGEVGNPFNHDFFAEATNALPVLQPGDAAFADYVQVINVPAATGGRMLELVMSGDEGRALAFLTDAGG